MKYSSTISFNLMLLAGLLAGSIPASTAVAQNPAGNQTPGEREPLMPGSSPGAPRAAASPKSMATPANTNSGNRNAYLLHTWGIDTLEVRSTSSGELLRFSYRVLNANKAKALNDKKYEPHLIDEASGYMLQIPVMEKVGQLRQTGTPQDGKQYWMVFSNKGKFVKPGSRVDVLIGNFRINGLVVDESVPVSVKQGAIK